MTSSRDPHTRDVIFTCDACDDTFDPGLDDFSEAWTAAKSHEWITRKIGSDWLHYCPDCGEGFR